MNFIADHEASCLCMRWTALPNFAAVWSTMAIDMSNERSQRDLSAKINLKFSQIKNKSLQLMYITMGENSQVRCASRPKRGRVRGTYRPTDG